MGIDLRDSFANPGPERRLSRDRWVARRSGRHGLFDAHLLYEVVEGQGWGISPDSRHHRRGRDSPDWGRFASCYPTTPIYCLTRWRTPCLLMRAIRP